MDICRVFAICSISFLLFCAETGCSEKPQNPVSQSGDALIGSYQRSKNTAEAASLESLKKAVLAYRAANGEYPKSLKEIEQLAGCPINVDKYDYDPATGALGLKSSQ